MIKTAFTSFLFFLLIVMPSVVVGQDMYPGQWWRMPQAAETLNLTDKQKLQLDDLYHADRKNLNQLKDSIENERDRFSAILEEEPLNEAAVMAQFRKLEEARTTLAAEKVRYIIEVRKLLGPQRFQRLKTYYNTLREKEAQRNAQRLNNPPPQVREFNLGPWGINIRRR